MENNEFLEGWECLGSLYVYDYTNKVKKLSKLFGKDVFGRVRYRLINDSGDYMVFENESDNEKLKNYSYKAARFYFNFEE